MSSIQWHGLSTAYTTFTSSFSQNTKIGCLVFSPKERGVMQEVSWIISSVLTKRCKLFCLFVCFCFVVQLALGIAPSEQCKVELRLHLWSACWVGPVEWWRRWKFGRLWPTDLSCTRSASCWGRSSWDKKCQQTASRGMSNKIESFTVRFYANNVFNTYMSSMCVCVCVCVCVYIFHKEHSRESKLRLQRFCQKGHPQGPCFP